MRKRFSDIKHLGFVTVEDPNVRLVGKVSDLLVEEGSWDVRYIVVDIEQPTPRRVLISPASITGLDSESQTITTFLSADRVIASPPLESSQPISRQYEQALVDYYGWPIYWFGKAMLNPQALGILAPESATEAVRERGDANLRSANELCGYRIESQNGPAGVMKDLIVQVESWQVDFATAEPRTWLPTESSMFSTGRIDAVDWVSRKVTVNLSKLQIEALTRHNEPPAISVATLAAQSSTA